MLEGLREQERRDALLSPLPEEDAGGVWMLSYIDVMTLLVALFALLLSIAGAAEQPAEEEAPAGPAAVREARVSPQAIVVALGVANARPAPTRPERPVSASVPPILDPLARPRPLLALAGDAPLELTDGLTPPLARVEAAAALKIAAATALPPIMLDERLSPDELEDATVVVTAAPPANVRRLDPGALAGAEALHEALEAQLAEAPRLPSLEGVEISRVAEGYNLRIQDRLLFDSAGAALIDEGREVVSRLVEIIQRHDGEVSVEGHTDSRDINTERFPSNWELSAARATAILRYLQDAGIDPGRLRAIGYADTRPLAGNDSATGRAANRRVEVIVHL